MSLKGGWKSMHKSEDVPERDYRLKVLEYQGPLQKKTLEEDPDQKWANEYLKVAIIDKPVEATKSPNCGERPDKEVVGRRNKIYLGSEVRGHNFGYRDVSMSMKLDGDAGIEGKEFEGLEFDGSWFKKDGYENVKPIIDWDWISAEEEKAGGKSGRSKKKASGRSASKSQSSEARRQRRRSS